MAKKRAAAVQLALDLLPADVPEETELTCLKCEVKYEPSGSSALYSTQFCSEYCQRDFIRSGLRSLTLEQCIRLHKRLEALVGQIKPPSAAELGQGM